MAALDIATCKFSHVHFYCDKLQPLDEYKKYEAKLNSFGPAGKPAEVGKYGSDVVTGRAAWLALEKEHGNPITGARDPAEYTNAKQDLVAQLLCGFGWRIVGHYDGPTTRSFELRSKDHSGAKFVISAPLDGTPLEQFPATEEKRQKRTEEFDHFSIEHLKEFAKCHNGRQGAAVLGFETQIGGIEKIRAKYEALHPKLLIPDSPREYGGVKILEVYAYYLGDKCVTDADHGTVIRFVEREVDKDCPRTLPGLALVEAAYDEFSYAAYSDHWVSNVVSRTGFIDTLHDTIGFSPKVDFNAGVVAAGEAQIESTVAGNTSATVSNSQDVILKDQSQIYLPINNSLSEVGHVHLFLQQLGQGLQHIASRVEDLVTVIQRTNDYRKMTGSGFTFLNIPRTYYGFLTARKLSTMVNMPLEIADKCVEALKKSGILDEKNVVDLDATPEGVEEALGKEMLEKELSTKNIVSAILRSRYGNMYDLLKDQLSESTYLSIVRNQILIDIQGDDLLMQIFTAKILLREADQEAPFLEFIQRRCSDCIDAKTGKPKPIKAGCGGFGIRNFLTLFLSIEVSKASAAKVDAERSGDVKGALRASKMVDAFTAQLDESNPVLTAISDAMTAEGDALANGDNDAAAKWAAEKLKGNETLQTISAKYMQMMRDIRAECA